MLTLYVLLANMMSALRALPMIMLLLLLLSLLLIYKKVKLNFGSLIHAC